MLKEIVKVVDLVEEFKMGDAVVQALRGVSFSVYKGELVAVEGPSGSGKSTLLNLVGGLDMPVSGRVLVDGVDISTLGQSQLAEYRLKDVGFIFQSFNLIPTLTAFQNVELPLIFAEVDEEERAPQVREALATVGLSERMSHKPTELSGGEQQRVAIARALINQPQVVLADEPTGNLDTQTGAEIMRLLTTLNRQNDQTFLVVTHDSEVSRHTDRTIYIRDGKINRVTGKETIW